MTARRIAAAVGLSIFWFGTLSVLSGPWCGAAAWAQEPSSKASSPAGFTAESLLRKTGGFYKKAQSMVVEIDRSQKIGPIPVQFTTKVVFQRPNRLAVRSSSPRSNDQQAAVPGIDLVIDGKTMFVSMPVLKKYIEGDAPATIDGLASNPLAGAALQFTMIIELCSADPYTKLMEGVKTATYAGLESVEGFKTHHLKFTQDQFDWEMWVAADGDPTVRRVALDLTKTVANSPVAAQLKNQKLEMIQDFKGWQFDRGVDQKSFAFQPPEGARKVKSFIDGLIGGGEAAPSELLGNAAPDAKLKLLDEGEFQLKTHRGARVVMLDFWATWCGPCVRELPILAEVAEVYKDKGVFFYAVNQREKPDQVRKFLADKKLKLTVALDSDGAFGSAYHVTAIPTLVLIDKRGTVQSVHVGYDPGIKATLRNELDSLLAGKDLAKDSLRATKPAEAKNEGFEQAWRASGSFTGVVADPRGQAIYAVQSEGECKVLDLDGKIVRTFRLPGSNRQTARFVRRSGGKDGLLAFGVWGPSVVASSVEGTKLWEETGGQGVDDVWAADLDGDEVDEAIVGYNGATGLHVFSADGKRLWSRTDLGNVWHVTAGDLDGNGKPEVVTTSAQGNVHVFSAGDGKPLRTLDAGLYANMVRTAPGRSIGSSNGDIVLVIGSAPSGEAMVALTGDGKIQWTIKLPSDTQHCDSLAISPDGNWAAAGLRGGRVCVVDIGRARIVAQTSGQGVTPMVAWAASARLPWPLLLVATGREINAYRVKPVAAQPDKTVRDPSVRVD
jgi:thiol-disulfide isomerase/thioredoxin